VLPVQSADDQPTVFGGIYQNRRSLLYSSDFVRVRRPLRTRTRVLLSRRIAAYYVIVSVTFCYHTR